MGAAKPLPTGEHGSELSFTYALNALGDTADIIGLTKKTMIYRTSNIDVVYGLWT